MYHFRTYGQWKTATSINLAKKFGGEIVNFDSLLFYKELNIGTAKPTVTEQQGIPHHLIDMASISHSINAADYIKLTLPIIEKIHNENKIVYLVGGSGFYLQALLYGMYDSITTPPHIIQRSNDLYEREGIAPFLTFLEENDPISFHRYHANDHYRLRRATEHYWTTGSQMSLVRIGMEDKKTKSPMQTLNWNVFHAYLDMPKNEHFKIICARTQHMLESGLMNEVSNLLKNGYTGLEKPMQSIGYKECLYSLQVSPLGQDQIAEKINIATRQLAKSQRTWFKKWDKKEYNILSEMEQLSNDFAQFIGS